MSDSSFHWEPWVRYWQGFDDELESRLREAHASLTRHGVQFESDRVEFRRAMTPVDGMWEAAIRRLGAEPSMLQGSSGVH